MNTGKPSLAQIRHELQSLKDYLVVVYGSWCTDDFTPRSDIDIAVVSTKKDPRQNKDLFASLLGKVPERYDIKIFELLPLQVQIAIADNHAVVFGTENVISAYFYHYRKLWKDVKHRYWANQFSSAAEKMQAARR